MNSDKTKLIWIGSKSKCKEKLNVQAKLDWDTTEFDLLGISFTKDLNKIPNLNYDRAIIKAKKIIKNWNTRHLTPLGKITVVKTLIASKFTHLFLTIPTLENFLKALNKEIFNFLWNSKPEKINRQDLCAEKINGGLKMVDITLFEKSLKLTWIRKIISNTNAPWLNLLLDTVGNLSRIKSLGPVWCQKVVKKCNPFWNNVFNYYMGFCNQQEIKSNSDILHLNVWLNERIQKDMFLPHWKKQGIRIVGDLVDSAGVPLSREQLGQDYRFSVNILEYYSVKKMVGTLIRKHSQSGDFLLTRPYIPFHIQTFMKQNSSSKIYYNLFIKSKSELPRRCETRWNVRLGTILSKEVWSLIYKICFRVTTDNSTMWFQYKLIYNILATRSYLFNLKITDSNTCGICGSSVETIQHLFTQCSNVQTLWSSVLEWIKEKINQNYVLGEVNKLFGYLVQDQNFLPMNFILLLTREYIFWCAKKKLLPKMDHLKIILNRRYHEQKYISIINSKENIFEESWSLWKPLF